MGKTKHNHRIEVETDEEVVTLSIGADGGVPGGFAKLFNRIVDSEVWARLSDPARAAYIPLVRFADHRNQFRVQIGRAALMKYTGLSLSSIKRAMKDLLAQRLMVVVHAGGVNGEGENESNIYQLLVPADSRRPGVGSAVTPLSVRPRTPSSVVAEPPVGPEADGVAGRSRTASGDHASERRGSGGGPQFRSLDKEHSKTPSRPAPRLAIPPSATERAAALLAGEGMDERVAAELADAHSYQRIVDVVAAMQWRRARGKCDNPAGFMREALVKHWQTPKPVLDARAQADARARADQGERTAKLAARREAVHADQDEARVESLIAALDDEELTLLAESVLARHQGNAAVTSVLMRKGPRECRLMKMEIAAMLTAGAR